MSSTTRLANLGRHWASLPGNVRGGLWILASAVLFTVMSTLAKFLGGRLDPFQVAFFRAFVGLCVVLPFLIRQGARGYKTERPFLHLARGVVGSSAMMCGFYALAHLPLADATALSFARALFLVVLAVFVLREVVGIRRTTATIVGFIGVVIMLRPTGAIEPASFVALGGAFLVAFAVVFVKILSRTDGAVTLLFYSGVISTLATAIPAGLFWTEPTTTDLALLIAMGVFGVGAQSCFIRGYSVGDATALAPLDYTRLLFAAVAGFIFFSDIPDEWTAVGALIIVASTLYITYREAQLGKEQATDEAPLRPAVQPNPVRPGNLDEDAEARPGRGGGGAA